MARFACASHHVIWTDIYPYIEEQSRERERERYVVGRLVGSALIIILGLFLSSSSAYSMPQVSGAYSVRISIDGVADAAGCRVLIDGHSYRNGDNPSLVAGTHGCGVSTPSNWGWLAWFTSANCDVADPNSASTTLIVSGSGTFDPAFGPIVTFSMSPSSGGTVTAVLLAQPLFGRTYTNGESGTMWLQTYSLRANPASSYNFVGWTSSGCGSVDSSTSASTTWNPTGPGTLTATFQQTPSLMVQVSANPSSITTAQYSTIMVTVTSGGSTVSGASVSLGTAGGSLNPTSGTTDSYGRVTSAFSSSSTGTFTVSASASRSGYRSGSGSTQVAVTVVPPPQCTLAVSSTHDSPNPSLGSHSYNSRSSVTCSVSSPVTEGGVIYACTGWTGTGSVPSSGSGTSTTFTITQDSSITWNWAHQQSLSASLSPLAPSPIDVDQNVQFSSSASGGIPPYSFAWYLNGAQQSGQTGSTFAFTPSSPGSYTIKVVVTDSQSPPVATSQSAYLAVNTAFVAPSVSASPTTITLGESSSLTSSPLNTGSPPYSYQWLTEAPGSSSFYTINGATSSRYAFATSNKTTTGVWVFELQVSDATGVSQTSSQASVTANSTPSLSNGYVLPISGTTSTPFYYYVSYYSPAGAAPDTSYVVIDSSSVQTMNLYSGSASDGVSAIQQHFLRVLTTTISDSPKAPAPHIWAILVPIPVQPLSLSLC